MDSLIKEFRTAFAEMKGDQLAETIKPDVQNNAAKLVEVWGRGSIRDTTADLKFLFYTDNFRPSLSKIETIGWHDLYLAYWKAVGEILAVEGLRDDPRVRFHPANTIFVSHVLS